MADLRTQLLGYPLNSPLVLASGIWGTSPALMERAAISGAGAVTAKSCGPVPREGHPNPVTLTWEHGMLNAIGLSNPGAEAEAFLLADAKAQLAPYNVPLIASVFAGTPDEFKAVTRAVAAARPHIIEVNISCPNVAAEFGIPFAADPVAAAQVTEAAKRGAGNIPITVKLAPNVPSISRIAHAVIEAGADAITAINTMPGMLIDADAGMPVLSNGSGGMSGPALKPIALRCVYELAQTIDVPIIGTGGITTGKDAAEMLAAGATAIGVGSAVWFRGPSAFTDINAELSAWLDSRNLTIDQARGRALPKGN